MDGVARRAGVGKSTVYLRWQDKDSLLTEAVGTRSGSIGAVDTGTLRGDLEALAANLFHHFCDPAGWASLRVTIDAAGAPQRLGRFAEAVSHVQVEFVERIVARAVGRGEIPDGVSPNSIAECLYGSVTMQTLGFRLDGRDLDDNDIQERSELLATIVLEGVLP
jgi:AcrR family transcriptional regulator